MRKLISIILIGIALCSCGPTYVLPKEKDTTIVHVIDSVAFKDSTVYHHIYKEHFKDYASYLDTLNLETTYSTFKAWNDTTDHVIKGEAENKVDSLPVEIKWKTHTVYKDSIVTKDVPYPVEVEKPVAKIYNIALWIAIFSLLYFILKLVLRLTLKIKI